MTAPRTKYPRRPAAAFQLTIDRRKHLLHGWDWFGGGFTDVDEFRNAWEIHRRELMEEFRDHLDETFVRPFGWWFCDHGKERPIVPGNFSDEEIELHRREPLHFGFLHTHSFRGADGRYLQQPERDYLEDNKLLTAAERQILDELNEHDA
jgi:hypothetical protein